MKKFFIIVGWLNTPKHIIKNVFNEEYGDGKYQCWFLDKESYLKSQFSYANNHGKKIEAIFVGPVPHKSFAAKGNSSMVAQVSISNSITPVYVCRNKSGILKFTKTSTKDAIREHKKYVEMENFQIMEFKAFLKDMFPNQSLFWKNPLCICLADFFVYWKYVGIRNLCLVFVWAVFFDFVSFWFYAFPLWL